MAIKVGGTTVIDDSRNLTNIAGGVVVGVQSGGVAIGTGATTLNFTGSGNNFSYDSGTKTLNISISGGSGGVGGVTTTAIWSNPNTISTSFSLSYPNTNYFVVGPITVSSGSTITVSAGNTFRVL